MQNARPPPSCANAHANRRRSLSPGLSLSLFLRVRLLASLSLSLPLPPPPEERGKYRGRQMQLAMQPRRDQSYSSLFLLSSSAQQHSLLENPFPSVARCHDSTAYRLRGFLFFLLKRSSANWTIVAHSSPFSPYFLSAQREVKSNFKR